MVTFNNFAELLQSTNSAIPVPQSTPISHHVENVGGVTSVGAVQGASSPPPNIPQRVKSLEDRVGSLETKVDNGFAEMRRGFASVKQAIDEINKKLP
jgi:hypothetical protein